MFLSASVIYSNITWFYVSTSESLQKEVCSCLPLSYTATAPGSMYLHLNHSKKRSVPVCLCHIQQHHLVLCIYIWIIAKRGLFLSASVIYSNSTWFYVSTSESYQKEVCYCLPLSYTATPPGSMYLHHSKKRSVPVCLCHGSTIWHILMIKLVMHVAFFAPCLLLVPTLTLVW